MSEIVKQIKGIRIDPNMVYSLYETVYGDIAAYPINWAGEWRVVNGKHILQKKGLIHFKTVEEGKATLLELGVKEENINVRC